MSEETIELYEKRNQAYAKKNPNKKGKDGTRKFPIAAKRLYRKWVTRWTEEIERETRKGNTKTIIWKGVKSLCDTKKTFTVKPRNNRCQGTNIFYLKLVDFSYCQQILFYGKLGVVRILTSQ